jgi:ABC-type proline/glycine betaine transport system permease subunit
MSDNRLQMLWHVKLVLDLRYISGSLKFVVVVQVSFWTDCTVQQGGEVENLLM